MSAESECVRRNVIRASVCDCVGVVMLLWNSIISQNTKNEATESSVRFIANVHALNTLMTLIPLSFIVAAALPSGSPHANQRQAGPCCCCSRSSCAAHPPSPSRDPPPPDPIRVRHRANARYS